MSSISPDRQAHLNALHLYGMATAWSELLAEGPRRPIQPEAWMDRLIEAELADRQVRSLRYQLKAARFPAHRDLTGIDWAETPLAQVDIETLATAAFMETAQNLILVGGTETGKTHVATALGVAAIHQRKRVRFYNAVDLVNQLEREKQLGKVETWPGSWFRPTLSLLLIDRPTPRVFGIDDWAWRRGHRYGTVMVDLKTNTVVDLLPDREAATVATWLSEHPGVEIVAQDRASAYADGVRQGAPGAVQVTDRWHLLRNLGDAVHSLADKHSAAAGRAAEQVRVHLQTSAATTPSPVSTKVPATPTRAERASLASRARRQARYEEAAGLRAAGASIKRIAAELGTERKTVRRWLRLGHTPSWKQPSSGSMLDPFVGVLTRRWNEGCRNAAQLWRDLGSGPVKDLASTRRSMIR